MNSKPQIHIDYKCHEPSWNFIKGSKADFCKTCNKHVVDFTEYNENQLQKMLLDKNRPSCGKFYADQVVIDKETKHGPSLSKIILASAIASITTFTSSAQSNNKREVKTEQHSLAEDDKNLEIIIDSICETQFDVETKSEENEIIHLKPHSKSNKYYFSWRFPFVHKRLIRRTHIVAGRFL